MRIPLLLCLLAGLAAAQDDLLTAAEASGYTETTRYDAVQSFAERLAVRSERVSLGTMGQTAEGRALPLLIVADPPVATPEDVGERVVVFAFGAIHAGEVCGKEALLMLARDVALAEEPALLERVVLLFAPVFNADGNERVRLDNRPGQDGPARGMGTRRNALDLNLNRDFGKLAAPATRGLVQLLEEWDPALIVDTHTTNGSLHRYPLTHDGPRHPASHPDIVRFTRDELLPAAEAALEAVGDTLFLYGNFAEEHTRWTTYPPLPRYSTHYGGLRNRPTVLSEAYAYAPYERRVRTTYRFVEALAEACGARAAELRKMLARVDEEVTRAGRAAADSVAVRTAPAVFPAPRTVLGLDEDGAPANFSCEVEGLSVGTAFVRRPYAYLFPAELEGLEHTLRRHGIAVEELREDLELEVESYRLASMRRRDRPYEGVRLVRLEVDLRPDTVWIPAGTRVARTDQPLGNLLVVLMEPESEDGLPLWGALDGHLRPGEDLPLWRLPSATALLTRAPGPLPERRAPPKEPTVGNAPRSIGNSTTRGLRWLDAESFLQSREGRLYRVHATSGRAEPYTGLDLEALRRVVTDSLGLSGRRLSQAVSRATETHDPTRGRLLSHGGDLYYGGLDGSWRRLTFTPDEPELLGQFSPDDQRVAFVRGGDLYAVEVAGGAARALTSDGGGLISNGRTDWVYMEEVYGRGNRRAFWWSPDSSELAFLRFDDTPVPTFTLVDHRSVPPRIETTSYPKAGDPNPLVQLGLVSATVGEVRWADLERYEPEAMLVTGVGWTPGGEAWCYVQDRAQRWLEVNRVGADGATGVFLREDNGHWVDPPDDPRYLAGGDFLWLSERDGYQHLYRYAPDGALAARLTEGAWEVRSIVHVDEEAREVWFLGTREASTGSQLYRVSLDGGLVERVTFERGTHSVAVSPDGQHVIDTWSRLEQPPRVALLDREGRRVRMLDSNPVPELADWRLGEVRAVRIPLPDGFTLEGQLLFPPDFDPERRYPVWVRTYGGPHAPTVRDSWRGGRMVEHSLAGLGFVLFQVDPRSASGKGAVSTWAAYRQLGVSELADLEGAVSWLTAHHAWADPARIGLSGSSYGGFLTSFALTHSTMFRAGIASAPVTDWRLYDSIYTERYMDTPQNNPEGYAATSVIEAADQLSGALLLLHGGIDDNVHPQNTLRLAEELQKHGKDFEMMLYPSSRHGIRSAHVRRLQLRFMCRELEAVPGMEP